MLLLSDFIFCVLFVFEIFCEWITSILYSKKRKRDVKSEMKKHDLIGKLLLSDTENGFEKR